LYPPPRNSPIVLYARLYSNTHEFRFHSFFPFEMNQIPFWKNRKREGLFISRSAHAAQSRNFSGPALSSDGPPFRSEPFRSPPPRAQRADTIHKPAFLYVAIWNLHTLRQKKNLARQCLCPPSPASATCLHPTLLLRGVGFSARSSLAPVIFKLLLYTTQRESIHWLRRRRRHSCDDDKIPHT
jgi:hypothetical protein